MQTANVMVALGGDRINTVPVYGVTAAELAVLRAIHGDDAVHDIEPAEDVAVNNRAELARLKEKYKTENARQVVEALYPGAAARVFESLDELDLPEELFKAERPVKRAKAEAHDAPAKRKSSKKAVKAAKVAETDGDVDTPVEDDEDDGVEDMPDSELMK